MKVETFKLKDWDDAESGLVLSENEDWVLVKHIPVDYVIDGYRLYKKEFIKERTRSIKEEKIERVLILKGVKAEEPREFHFSDTISLLDWVEDKYGIFEFQDDSETELFYGKKNRTDGDTLIIDLVNSDGSMEMDYDFEYEISKIRVITFETDYHVSIRLLWEDAQKKIG